MYRFIIIFILSVITMPAFSATRTFTTQTPVYNPYYGAYYGGDYMPPRARYRYGRQHTSMFSDINDLERYAMNRNFVRENDRTRLERLENLAFGAVQEGDYRTRYNNVRNAILSRPKPNYKTSVLKNLSNYFGGQLTGFTPSIQNNYPSCYGQSYDSNYMTPFGHGFSTNNYGISSGSSIKLLD